MRPVRADHTDIAHIDGGRHDIPEGDKHETFSSLKTTTIASTVDTLCDACLKPNRLHTLRQRRQCKETT